MGFISVLFMMAAMVVIAVMCAIGLFFLLMAMIFYLLNRRREKKGEEKKRGYKIAETVFLVLGGINLAPTIYMLITAVINPLALLFLLIAMIFYLINRRREKKGEEKKRGYKIAGIVLLVLGAFGLAPTIEMLFRSIIFLLEDVHYAYSLAPIMGPMALILFAIAFGIHRRDRRRRLQGESPGRSTWIVFWLCLILGCIGVIPVASVLLDMMIN